MKDILFNKKILLLIVPAILILVWLLWPADQQASYQTKKVERGNITLSVMATGSLEPVNQVDVGTEVSGTVRKVFVDYNDRVKAGQLLAVLDTQKLEAQVVQSRSIMESSRATVDQSYAAVEESRQNLARLEKLFEVSAGRAPSQQDLEASRATVRKSEASYKAAIAQVREAEARLKLDQVNLQKASIRSPINGIVLSRVVEPGQTVAASLQTPTLFTIAETLTQLRLIVAVDEADIGMVKKGQEASFTVDAYPDRTFPASIEQVRYASEVTDNVVTYQTVLAVGN
ncbi:MAG: efflux RND transporter periplasmic adaptor subunit, partial [Leptospiraceae bacterium]|nr:efflux RND transporter periplasmic adaptor subunit [Leptospiraceae bacterium]